MLSGTPGILGRGPRSVRLGRGGSLKALRSPVSAGRVWCAESGPIYLPADDSGAASTGSLPTTAQPARWPPQEAATWHPPCHHLARRPRRRVFVPSVHRPEPATPAVTVASPRDVSFTCGFIETCG